MIRSYISRVTVIAIIILFALMGISIWFGKTTASTEQFHKKNIDYLESKRDNAKALSGSASASSVLISMLPEDTATPVANQIANIGTDFLIILSALTAEQNLLMITGEISFCWMIPIALAFLIIFAIVQRKLFLQIGVKLLICGIVIFMAVPLTLQVTRMADKPYQEAVDETLTQSQNFENLVNGQTSETSSEDPSSITTEAAAEPATENTQKKETKESKEIEPWYESTWNTITDTADAVSDSAQTVIHEGTDFIQDTAHHIAEGVSDATDSTITFVQSIPGLPEEAAKLLDDYTEAFVIMMVTTCVLPVIVLIGCVLVMNMLLNIDPDWDGAKLYRPARKSHSRTSHKSEEEEL